MPIVSASSIASAALALSKGDVVAMPTETVYGLAGRIDLPQALEKIFLIKQRPFFDPLIVHIESKAQAFDLTTEWSDIADFLADSFWPGPLTMVLPKSPRLDSLITSGLESVGLRCPKHPLALELLKKVGVPLAAPSANRFGRTSPTSPQHVQDEFPDSDLLILDGGPCEVGIESTVLKIQKKNDVYNLFILRKGLITQEMIEEKLSKTHLKFQFLEALDKSASPGHLEHHYMPSIPLIYCLNPAETPKLLLARLKTQNKIQITFNEIGILKLPNEATLAARQLYSELRRLSQKPYDALVFYKEDWQNSEAWQAIIDRIYRASLIKVLSE